MIWWWWYCIYYIIRWNDNICSFEDGIESIEDSFTEVFWIVESSVLIKSIDLIHFNFSQLKVEDIDVFCNSVLFLTFWNYRSASLNCPSKSNLCRWFTMIFSNAFNKWMFVYGFIFFAHAKFNVCTTTEATESCYSHIIFLTKSQKCCLG